MLSVYMLSLVHFTSLGGQQVSDFFFIVTKDKNWLLLSYIISHAVCVLLSIMEYVSVCFDYENKLIMFL